MRRSIRVVRPIHECAAKAATRRWPVNRRDPASAGEAEPRVYPRIMRRSSLVLVAAALLVVPLRFARAQVIAEAVELDRAGPPARAAGVYMAGVRREPANPAALHRPRGAPPPPGRRPRA